MTIARKNLIQLESTQYFHITNRVVRRAFLIADSLNKDSKVYNYRRDWIERRLLLLAEAFTIDILAYSLMSNHYHLCVFVDVKKNSMLSNNEVISRWQKVGDLHPILIKYLSYKERLKLTEEELFTALNLIDKYRKRLASISWMMRYFNYYIAKRANKEDGCTGHFWEGRFFSQSLLDVDSILNCMAYDDLNPLKAGIKMPGAYTSLHKRLQVGTCYSKLTAIRVRPQESHEDIISKISLKSYIDLIQKTAESLESLSCFNGMAFHRRQTYKIYANLFTYPQQINKVKNQQKADDYFLSG